MEDSRKIFFADDSPRFHISVKGEILGPLSPSEIVSMIQVGNAGWGDPVWFPTLERWKRLFEIQEFEGFLPKIPDENEIERLKSETRPKVRTQRLVDRRKKDSTSEPKLEKPWYLYYNESQFGPYDFMEVVRLMQIGRIHERVHAFSEGMDDWERLVDIKSFAAFLPSAFSEEPSMSMSLITAQPVVELRQKPRRPLLARILIPGNKEVFTGICRDISVGGMQVLIDRLPGTVGQSFRLNVSPSNPGMMKPFVAEGQIVRIHDDGKGFSFLFRELDDAAREALEQYTNEQYTEDDQESDS